MNSINTSIITIYIIVQNMCFKLYILFVTIQYSFYHDRTPSFARCKPSRTVRGRRPESSMAQTIRESTTAHRFHTKAPTFYGHHILPKLFRGWNVRLRHWSIYFLRLWHSGRCGRERWNGLFLSSCGVRQSERWMICSLLGFAIVIISIVFNA